MIDQLIGIDTQALLAVNGLHAAFLDPVMKMLSGKLVWLPMYVAIACLMILRFGVRRGLLLIGAIGLAVGLSDVMCAHIIRPVVARLRPCNPDNPIAPLVHIVNGYRSGGYSFPSCHACNAVALAVSSSLIMRERPYTIFISLWAALQCYTRLYLGVHYPGDLLAGALVGAAMALLVCLPATTIIKGEQKKQGAVAVILIGVITVAICFAVSAIG